MADFLKRLGQVIQGIILGIALLSALVMMMQIESGARVFKYQGF
jgi:hypothetical protein